MSEREVFTEVLIHLLETYKNNERGPFGLAMFAPAHLKAADEMIMKAKIFGNNPTDESWNKFVSAFTAFHEELVTKQSTTLLPAIHDFVAKSAFPHILSIVTDFNRLNVHAGKMNNPETIKCPEKVYVIDDLARELSHISITTNNDAPIPMTTLINIQSVTNDGETIREITQPASHTTLYAGRTSTEKDAEAAVSAISEQLGTTFPNQRSNKQLQSIIPFFSQNGILEKPIADCFAILKVCTYLDSVKDPVKLPAMDNMEGIRKAVDEQLSEFGFEPTAPTYSVNIDVSESGITVTETFLFEKYRLMAGMEADPGEAHSLTTPIKAVNTFKCEVAEDGQSATIKDQTIVFSASHPTPKDGQKASSKMEHGKY